MGKCKELKLLMFTRLEILANTKRYCALEAKQKASQNLQPSLQ